MCLFKCIRGLLSENPLPMNVLTSPKNSWNPQKSTFIIPFLHSWQNWVRKSYFQSDHRLFDCLITPWLETASILVVIQIIDRYQHLSNYRKNHRAFATFFFAFLVSTWNFQCFEKNMSRIFQVFVKLLTPKYALVSMPKRACF